MNVSVEQYICRFLQRKAKERMTECLSTRQMFEKPSAMPKEYRCAFPLREKKKMIAFV